MYLKLCTLNDIVSGQFGCVTKKKTAGSVSTGNINIQIPGAVLIGTGVNQSEQWVGHRHKEYIRNRKKMILFYPKKVSA